MKNLKKIYYARISAKNLQRSALKEEDVTFVRSHVDYDDGVMEYEVEFYAGNKEYDYDIDPATEAIRSMDQDCEFYVQ